MKFVACKEHSLTATLSLTSLLRRALMSQWGRRWGNAVPEWLSGHRPDGGPSLAGHLAIYPCSVAGAGKLHGLTLMLPRPSTEAAYAPIDSILRAGLRLYDGRGVDEHLFFDEHPEPSSPELARGRQWASVTPVVLDRFPKARAPREHAVQTIVRACRCAGYPSPEEVVIVPRSPLPGIPSAGDFPPFHNKSGRGYRWHCHVLLLFDREIDGPLLIGAGRYQGYGLLQPLDGLPLR